MEDLIKDYKLQIEELRSLIIILQKAVRNEDDDVLKSDINNYLEIATDKINSLILNVNTIIDTVST